ncbi:MAG: biotin--[acetyl-CoA-carboxylase] ligase [Deltaproteobacteria bacterium]|nr:biotin--[acetyl-CoA-carboxylase] ligase [Deltaproteobacteria bacterium]
MGGKEELLERLKKAEGHWVSGEMLSGKMSITRTAVWKYICKLRDEGYEIKSAPRKGYLLHRIPDRLLPREVRSGLGTKAFGQGEIIHFSETDSTNSRAKELAGQGIPEGTIVLAERQTGGRGRRGRSWFSPDGSGLYVSLILRPEVVPAEAPMITLMTAVAVCDALVPYLPLPPRVKWPNDILAGGRKIAGILTEISTEPDAIDYVVVGLGLNVNVPARQFPKGIRDKATSILVETGKTHSRAAILRSFLENLERSYALFREGRVPLVLDRWRSYAGISRQCVRVDQVGRVLTGEIQDIDEDGSLLLRDERGHLHHIVSGDVYYL